MRNPSTGNAAAPQPTDDPAAGSQRQDPGNADDHADSRAQTRANVEGRTAPRAPHERDESSDSGTGAPSELMKKGHDDVVAGKTATDKGEATDEVYRRSLRGRTPGPERD
ncbi:MAG: hypothetical protein ACXWUL_01585 [Caldimonas sp.]